MTISLNSFMLSCSSSGQRQLSLVALLCGSCRVRIATDTLGKVAGFSLHAGVAAKAHERKKLERLCRYISRPVVSEKRLSLTSSGKVRYELKTPYRDGTSHVIFEPLGEPKPK